MTYKQQQNQEESMPNPQKFKWKQSARYKTYEKADAKRQALIGEGEKHVKVRRCGPEGTQFKVIIGTPLETKSKKSKTTKQKEEKTNDTKK